MLSQMLNLFKRQEKPSHDNNNYWREQSKRLFPNLGCVDFFCASIGQPMKVNYYGPGQIYDGSLLSLSEIKKDVELTRAMLSGLLNTKPEALYFEYNTTRSMERVLDSLKITRESEIITTEDEYGSIAKTIQLTGAAIKVVKTDGNIIGNIERSITNKTQAIITSYITHSSCKVLPVQEIAQVARNRGIYHVVDAAQAIGHIPVDIEEIRPDALVGCGHKWLRGKAVSGIFYLSDRIDLSWNFLSSPYSIHPSKRRQITLSSGATLEEAILECDSIGNSDAIAHLGQCLLEYAKLGWSDSFRRINYLGNFARELLSSNKNGKVLDTDQNAPGMIAFRLNQGSHEALANFLGQRKISAVFKQGISFRSSPDFEEVENPEEEIIRISVSPFNTTQDIIMLNQAIEDFCNK